MSRVAVRGSSLRDVGALSLSGGATSPLSPLSPRHSHTSPSNRLSASISRPDDVGALANMMSKKKFDSTNSTPRGDALVRAPNPKERNPNLDAKSKLLQTPAGETCITRKEEALEQIMCAEALAGFERMARHQLDRRIATRTTMDPDKADADMGKLSELYLDQSDFDDPDSESDSEMIDKYDLQWFSAGPDDTTQSISGRVLTGYGFCKSKAPLDRIFTARCANYTLVGLINGHGSRSVGEELVRFISDEFCKALFKSAWLTQENDVVTALKHAFDRTHRRAIKQLDCRLTGACTTVLLFDEERVYVAHVGNCRAVLAVPDPNMNAQSYHYIPVPLTEDHKLAVRSEFDRILECGGEVRRLMNDNVHRLFFKEDSVPGLTLTRGIGHQMAHRIGIMHLPTISVLERRDFHKDSFIFLGSGGVWHSMSERGIVNWVGKHFANPHEACKSVAEECKRRWDNQRTRLQAFVHRGSPESFGALLVYPSMEERSIVPTDGGKERRQFVLGPPEHEVPVWPMPKTRIQPREWKHVKQTNWKEDLAIIMAGGLPDRDVYGQD